MKLRNFISVVIVALFVSGCQSTSSTLYEELGGKQGVNQIVENFVVEIENSEAILPYFEGSNIDRFIDKLSEQICAVSNGPCTYTGEDMERVHAGMNITEAHFNATVDLLINAMDKAGVAHTTQNKLLAQLAPTRKEMLYK